MRLRARLQKFMGRRAEKPLSKSSQTCLEKSISNQTFGENVLVSNASLADNTEGISDAPNAISKDDLTEPTIPPATRRPLLLISPANLIFGSIFDTLAQSSFSSIR